VAEQLSAILSRISQLQIFVGEDIYLTISVYIAVIGTVYGCIFLLMLSAVSAFG
jgi:hypothetical protein